MPASLFSKAEESGRAAARSPACRSCRCYSSLMPAHGLAYISSFHFSTLNPNLSLFSVESTRNYKPNSFSQASHLVAVLISTVWMARIISPLIQRKPVPEPWLPTTPSTAARHPTCLEPPWPGGMFCAGCCPRCPFSAASSCGRRPRGKPGLAMLTQEWCQQSTGHRALPRTPAVRSLSRAVNSVYCEPEGLPQSRPSRALRKGGNRPRRTFPSKVKESTPPPSHGEWEGGEDNSVVSTSNAQSQPCTTRHCGRVRMLQRVAILLNLVNIFEGKTPLCLWQDLYHHSVFTDADPSFFHLEGKKPACLMMWQSLSAIFLGCNDIQIILKICTFSHEPC